MRGDTKQIWISSACPVVVDFIAKYHPECQPNVFSVLSPLLTHCKMLRAHYGNDIATVFIGPCIAKKKEAEKHPELLDAVLTFEDLDRWLNEENIHLEKISQTLADRFEPEEAEEGALYPIVGGMVPSLAGDSEADRSQFMSFSGVSNVEQALKGVAEWKPSEPYAEAAKRDDRYLAAYASSRLALYAGRAILAHNRMLHILRPRHHLHLRVLDDHFLDEGLVQRYVNVLVDRRGDHETAVLAVVRWKIRSAAAQRDPHGAARDDHRDATWYIFSMTRSAACASRMPGTGSRRSRISSRNSANSVSQELSAIGYSQIVVSGGPISGDMR